MFKGENTTVFWVGLLALGYSLTQFCTAISQSIYYFVIYQPVYDFPEETLGRMFWSQISLMLPLIISGVIFAVIGLYMMKKGVKQEQPSTQN